mgnify:CR=1 FL=1
MTIEGVIFDFDGVLADTERLHLRAIQDALASAGHTLDEGRYVEQFLGYGDRDVFVEFAKAAAWPDRKSTRLNSSHVSESRMPSSA